MTETLEAAVKERRSLYTVRLKRWGKRAHVICLPPRLIAEMGLVLEDVIGIRVRIVQGRRFLIGERIALSKLAIPPELPTDVL
jgi:hypothetical protein